jgi:hypothetical protein
VRRFGIPPEVVREAFGPGSLHRREAARSLDKVRTLCVELGLVGPAARRWWRLLGVWA